MINIDTERIRTEIDNLQNINDNLYDIFSDIRKNTNLLKNEWETETSEAFFNDMNKFYNTLDNVYNTFEKDISTLNGIVNSNYEREEEKKNSDIDNNIAI